jgi:HlyD family secretion protein
VIKPNAARLRFRTLFWGGVALLIALLLALAFRPRAVGVEVGSVTRGALTVAVRDEGRTRVRESYVVSAPLAGRLLRIGNRAGDAVNDGEVVAGILPGDPVLLDERTRREAQAAVQTAQAMVVAAQAELQRAQAQQAHAQAEAGRVESLFSRAAVSQSARDRARLDARAAAAAVASARAMIATREAELEAARARIAPPTTERGGAPLVELRAPVGGRVLRVLQPSEAVVAAGTPILEIGDPRDLEVVAEMLSSDAVQIAEGAAVAVEGWGGPALRGRVRLVEPYGFLKVSALGVDEQRVNVVIDLVDPPDEWSALGHGYRVEVAISVWSAGDALQVPVAALLRAAGHWSVFRVEGERARRVPVEIGRNDGRSAELRSGLKPGDTVVLHPGPDLDDGVRVRRR